METNHKNLEDELATLLRARSTALVQGDVPFFRQHLADDFCYTNASGAVLDKITYLEFYIESEAVQWQAQDLDEMHIRLYGDVAVVTCRIHDRALFGEQELDAYFRSTQVFARQGHKWRYVAGHTSTAGV